MVVHECVKRVTCPVQALKSLRDRGQGKQSRWVNEFCAVGQRKNLGTKLPTVDHSNAGGFETWLLYKQSNHFMAEQSYDDVELVHQPTIPGTSNHLMCGFQCLPFFRVTAFNA